MLETYLKSFKLIKHTLKTKFVIEKTYHMISYLCVFIKLLMWYVTCCVSAFYFCVGRIYRGRNCEDIEIIVSKCSDMLQGLDHISSDRHPTTLLTITACIRITYKLHMQGEDFLHLINFLSFYKVFHRQHTEQTN